MALTIKELLAADTVSQAADKINFNFDQLLLNGGGPAGPQGPQGPPGPIGGRGIRGSQWYEDPNTTGGPTDPNGILFQDLEPNDSYLANDGNVWEYDGTVWVNTGIDLTGPQGAAAQGFWSETGNPQLTGKQLLYPSLYSPATGTDPNQIRTVYVGGYPLTAAKLGVDNLYEIPLNVTNQLTSSLSAMAIQVPGPATRAITFVGPTNGSIQYTDNLSEMQSISLLNGDLLSFDDKLAASLGNGQEYAYKIESLNRSMFTRVGREYVIESNTTSLSAPLTSSGDIKLLISNVGTGTTSAELKLVNQYSPNSASLFVGTSNNTFSTNPITGNIWAESNNYYLNAGNEFNVVAKGSNDAITLDASNDGNVVLYASKDIYLKTTGSPNVSNIYIGDPDPTSSGDTTNLIEMLAVGGITLRRTSVSTAGIFAETGNFWNYSNNQSDHLTLLAENRVNIKAKNLTTLTAGAQDGDYYTTNPVTGSAGVGQPSDGNIEITVHGGDVAEQGGKIINRLKNTYTSTLGEGKFIVINSTRDDGASKGAVGSMNNLQVSSDQYDYSRLPNIIGQWKDNDSDITAKFTVPSMSGPALYINSTVDPNISGTTIGYDMVYPLLKIGHKPREGGNLYGNTPSIAKDGGYFGGGSHIVGPYGVDGDLKIVGAPPSQNKWGKEAWAALHLRSGVKYQSQSGFAYDQGIYSPGAVWLYVPENTGTGLQATNQKHNSLRLWGTSKDKPVRSFNPEINPGITPGGTTIGLNMLAESATGPSGIGINGPREVGAGQNTVVGRIGLYGRADIEDYPDDWSQSPDNNSTANSTGTWPAVGGPGNGGTAVDVDNQTDQEYASVNVGDELRSRQTFKVFGQYVGDHYSSQFGGDYFGPTIQNQLFLAGAQENVGFSNQWDTDPNDGQYVRSGMTTSIGSAYALTYRYRYSWQKVGRVVTFSGKVDLADKNGNSFSTSDLYYGSERTDLGGYGSRIQLRIPLPVQLNKGGQGKADKGYVMDLRAAYPQSMSGTCIGVFTDDENHTPGICNYDGVVSSFTGTAWNRNIGTGTVETGNETEIIFKPDVQADPALVSQYMWLQLNGMSPMNFMYYLTGTDGEVRIYPKNSFNALGQNPTNTGTTPTIWFWNTTYNFTGTYELGT